ncbi:MAG: hypothetical protein JKY37_26190 [Nannocystaceae bacterium]|nr:hypothetical protein [Nannocystaceae bacterium]
MAPWPETGDGRTTAVKAGTGLKRAIARPIVSSVVARRIAVSVVLAAAFGALGCGVNGDDPNAWGMVQYVHADRTFALEYLSPPWEPLHVEPGLRLRITPEVFGFDIGIAASTHGLDIVQVAAEDQISKLQGVEVFVPEGERFDPLAGLEIPARREPAQPLALVDLADPFAVARAELTNLALEHDAKIDFDLSTVHNDAGQEGVTFQVVTGHDTFMRVVYLPSAPTVVRVAMVSVFDLATADIDQMLDGVITNMPVSESSEGSEG